MKTRREVRRFYRWAQTQGAIAYYLQQWAQREQLLAITGGQEPDRFIAERNAEMAALLRQIDAKIERFVASLPPRRPSLVQRLMRLLGKRVPQGGPI